MSEALVDLPVHREDSLRMHKRQVDLHAHVESKITKKKVDCIFRKYVLLESLE